MQCNTWKRKTYYLTKKNEPQTKKFGQMVPKTNHVELRWKLGSGILATIYTQRFYKQNVSHESNK